MKLYTLNLTVEEEFTVDEELIVDTNDYVRGTFTTPDKAIEMATNIIDGVVDIGIDRSTIKEIFVMEYEADIITSGVAIIGWLNEDGKFWKYFELKDEKFITYKHGTETVEGD